MEENKKKGAGSSSLVICFVVFSILQRCWAANCADLSRSSSSTQREEEFPALRWLYSACDNFEQFYARLQLLLTPTERTVGLPPCSVEYPTEEECAHEVGSVVRMLV